jgi:glycosyltransferase involved in cell wall biosynthesis
MSPRISVIVVTLNEGDNLRRTVENLRKRIPPSGEIIVVDDGSTDGSTDFLHRKRRCAVRLVRSDQANLSKARNFGASQAQGDILVFADAHIETSPGWWQPIVDLLANPEVGAVGPAVSAMGEPECVGYGQGLAGPDLDIEWLDCQQDEPYPVCMTGGCFIAMRSEIFRAVGGFDEGMIRWGSEDIEMCLRLWLWGYQVWVAPQVDVAHLFREQFPYDVDWTHVIHNKLRTAFVHFHSSRIAQVVDALREHEGFSPAVAQLVESDFAARRARLAEVRKRDDEWLFNRFGIAW